MRRPAAVVALLAPGTVCALKYLNFKDCRDRVLDIRDRGGKLGDINNVTLIERGYLYNGTLQGLYSSHAREDILTLTLERKRALICQRTLLTPFQAASLYAEMAPSTL